MKLTVRAMGVLIGLALVRGVVGAEQGGTPARQLAQPVAEAPQRPAEDDGSSPEPAALAGDSAAPASGDDAAAAGRHGKSADAPQSAQRESLWLLLLQLLRSPR